MDIRFRPSRPLVFTLLTGVWIAYTSVATAAVARYVATNGNNSTHDSWSTAYTNVQDALNAAGEGDTIYLAGHTFPLGATNLIWTRPGIALLGGYAATNNLSLPGNRDTAQWPTIVAAQTNGSLTPYFRLLTIQGVTNGLLEGVRFYGGTLRIALSSENTGGSGLLISLCSNLTVASCVVTGAFSDHTAGGTFGTAYGGIWVTNSQATISNCVVRNNRAFGNSGGYGAGLGIAVVSGRVDVVDTVIQGNFCGGNGNLFGFYGGGLYNHNGRVRIRNSLITGNSVDMFQGRSDMVSQGGGLFNNAGTLIVENCTIANNTVEGIRRVAGTVAVTNSILWANGDDVTGTVTLAYCCVEDGDNAGVDGCIGALPQFINGFYLAAGSPCVNQGTNNAADWGLSASTTQADGTPDSGRVDMGFHYAAGLTWQDVYVKTNGNDTFDGSSWANAYQTITKALSRARNGTRIHLAAGSYTNKSETFPLVVSGLTGVELLGTNAATTIVNAAGATNRVFWINADGVKLEGLSVIGGYAKLTINLAQLEQGGAGIEAQGAGNFMLADCSVTGNLTEVGGTYGTGVGGGLRLAWSSTLITNCTIANNRTIGNSGGRSYGAGVFVTRGAVSIADSTFNANQASGAGNAPAITGINGGGLYNQGGSVRWLNSLITANQSTMGGRGIAHAIGDLVALNCTIANNAGDGVWGQTNRCAITNSILWANGDDVTGQVTLAWCDIEDGDSLNVNGCISADPVFTSGFYLGAGSPCINAGTNPAAFWGLVGRTTQLSGDPDSGAVDLGYHYLGNLEWQELYVKTNGDNSAAGDSWDTALKSITAALAKSRNATRIHVAAGRYTNGLETFPLTINNWTGFELRGTNFAATIIDAAGANTRGLSVSGNGIVIEGLTIRGGNIASSSGNTGGGGIDIQNSANVQVLSCEIVSNKCADGLTFGITRGGGLRAVNSSVLISNCLFRTNQADGGSANLVQGGGISIVNGSATLVETVVEGNRLTGWANCVGLLGGGVHNAGGAVTLRNCLAVKNQTTNTAGGIASDAGTTVLDKGTIAQNRHGLHSSGSAIMSATNSIIWGNGDDVTGLVALAFCNIETPDSFWTNTVNGCIQQDPLFADTNYYHLLSRSGYYEGGYFSGGAWNRGLSGSACIDAGMPGSDYSREPSPNGGRVNLGYDGNTAVASLSALGGTLFLFW